MAAILRLHGILSGWLCVGLLLVLTACSPEEGVIHVDLSRREPVRPRSEPSTITYAYLPQYSHTVSYLRHHPLVEYLRAKTGLNIRQVFPETFDQHMMRVGRGEIDISFVNPFIYVKLAHKYGAMAFARIVESGECDKFRGQIICREDDLSIRSLPDCRGKRWIAVDPTSAGGYLYPLGHFIENGLHLEDFAEIAFAPGPGGKQEKVVLAVFAGKYDFGTIREGTLEVVADKIDLAGIRVVDDTPWYPGWVYAARAGLDPAIVSAIEEALLKLDREEPAHRAILEAAQFTRVIESDDTDFDPVRRLAEQVGIPLSE